MSDGAWSEAGKVVTLREAHEAVAPLRPVPGAPAKAWLNFYRRSAAVYRRVAEVDRDHYRHAMYWADREQARADALASQPATIDPVTLEVVNSRQRGGKTRLPATLDEAYQVLQADQPAADATRRVRLAYHEYAAAVYAEVAEVDRAHHHEAAFCVSWERARADELARSLEEKGGAEGGG